MSLSLLIILVLLGFLLLAIELLITPGMGVPGILGLASLVGGVVLAFITYGNTVGAIFLTFVVILFGVSIWAMLRSKTWKRISLSESITAKADLTVEERGLVVGEKGVTTSRLTPSGKARFNNQDLEVWSRAGIIDNGSEVEIVSIEENKIYVTKI